MPRTNPPGALREARAFGSISWRLFLYLLYRLRLRPRPTLLDVKEDVLIVLARLLGWRKRLRIVQRDNCPRAHPAVFCANHARIGDPFVIECCIHWASGSLWVDHMMRDDFFPPMHKNAIYDADELLAMLGAHQINRDKVSIGQLKVYVELLKQNHGFLMFPMGTRSRTGFFMEPRTPQDAPGGCAFFVAQAQRSNPDLPIPVVPIGRTYDPVTRETAIVFGEPLGLAPGAGREEQRALDLEVAAAIGGLVEVTAGHLTAGILYLRALQGRPASIEKSAVCAAVQGVAEKCGGVLLAPQLRETPSDAVRAALRYFEKAGMLEDGGEAVRLGRERILACPPHDRTYKKQNPLKFVLNQIIHLESLVCALEDAAGELD